MLTLKRVKITGIAFIIAALAAAAFAGEGADQSLKNLMDGNKHFVSGNLEQNDLSDARRKELAKGQKPFAVLVTCSDSRVSPELLFNQGLGDVFVIRTAGNVVDPIAIGSIEYAAEHLHSPLIMVMGHEKCGAVTAAVDTVEKHGKPEGNIGAIVEKIIPAVESARKKGGSNDEILDNAIRENARNTGNEILLKSSIIQHLVHENKVKIVAAEYSLNTGAVELLDMPAEKKHHEAPAMSGH